MAIDKNKIIQSAQKFIQKQQWDKALKEYLRLAEAFPQDHAIRLKVGELYARMGKKREAVEELSRVAENYAKTGFYSRAVAVYKQALKIDESQVDLFVHLGDLYQKLNIARDAMGQYRIAVNLCEKNGELDKALEILQKMSELESPAWGVRSKIAELKCRMGRVEEGRREFQEIAQEIRSQGRTEELISFLERVVGIFPDSSDELRELAKFYLERKEPEKALSKIKLLIESGKRDEEVLNYLARVYLLQGKNDRAISVYREMLRIFREEENQQKLKETAETLLKLNPNDPEAQKILGIKKVPTAPPLRPAGQPPASGVSPSISSPRPRPILGEETSRRFLTEADVYLKYGLKDKAIEVLKGVIKTDPDNEPALRYLLNIYMGDSRFDLARETAQKLAEVYQKNGEVDRAQETLALVKGIGPPSPVALEVSLEAEVPLPASEKVTPPPPTQPEISQEVEIDFPEEDFITGPEVEVPSPPSAPAHEPAERVETFSLSSSSSSSPPPPPPPPPESLTEESEGIVSETSASPSPPAPVIEEEIEFDIDEGKPDVSGLTVPGEPPGRPEIKLQFEKGDVIESEGIAEEAESRLPEIDEELDEAEFYLQQGLREEAIKIYQKILAVNPTEPRALERLRNLEVGMLGGRERREEVSPESGISASVQVSESPEFRIAESGGEREELPEYQGESADEFFAAEPEEGTFDLALELEDELGKEAKTVSEGPSFEEIFSEFKKGVEREISDKDAQAHYDLGIAYREMGLLDDAIQEFTIAASDPEKEVDCYNLIGLCHLDKGEIAEAIAAYIKGLKSPTISKAGAIALSYELGVAYQSLGKNTEALKVFERIARSDPEFRDIRERIADLRKIVSSPSAPQGAEVESSEGVETESGVLEKKGRSEDVGKPLPENRQRKISFV